MLAIMIFFLAVSTLGQQKQDLSRAKEKILETVRAIDKQMENRLQEVMSKDPIYTELFGMRRGYLAVLNDTTFFPIDTTLSSKPEPKKK